MGGPLSYERYHWFDRQVRLGAHPNATTLARQFEISTKQAQRTTHVGMDPEGREGQCRTQRRPVGLGQPETARASAAERQAVSPRRDAIQVAMPGTPAWNVETNHWPGDFPVFGGHSLQTVTVKGVRHPPRKSSRRLPDTQPDRRFPGCHDGHGLHSSNVAWPRSKDNRRT